MARSGIRRAHRSPGEICLEGLDGLGQGEQVQDIDTEDAERHKVVSRSGPPLGDRRVSGAPFHFERFERGSCCVGVHSREGYSRGAAMRMTATKSSRKL